MTARFRVFGPCHLPTSPSAAFFRGKPSATAQFQGFRRRPPTRVCERTAPLLPPHSLTPLPPRITPRRLFTWNIRNTPFRALALGLGASCPMKISAPASWIVMCQPCFGSKPRLRPGFRRLRLSECWGRAEALSDGSAGLAWAYAAARKREIHN